MNSGNISKDEKFEKIKNKYYFDCLKSDFILKKIFINLKRTKLLEIVNHNKKLQKRLNLNINDYKNYYELYSPIEIELIFNGDEYNKFINISNEEKGYYHIYFDNSKKDIENNNYNQKMDSKKISCKEGIIKKKSNNKLENLKSDFFFEKIINNSSKKRALEFLKYNKKAQRRTNFNIDDYKKYCESYSSIEIEIIPAKGKYGEFININEEDRSYYHIYFNNNKKTEIKGNILKKNKRVKLITIKIDCQVKSFKNLFYNCKCIEAIKFKQFARNNITDMSYMFYGCSSLKELNLSNFNTNNVINMSNMFYGCKLLEELNLSKFNTYKVTNMNLMFNECVSLKRLNLSNFNTSEVKDMSYMFCSCSLLDELDLTNFNTSNVTNIADMFYHCSSLNKLNISNFNTNRVINMSEMFRECTSLEKINLQNFNTGKVRNMNGMFYSCIKLKEINISSSFSCDNVPHIDGIFNECISLLNIPNIFNINNEIFSDDANDIDDPYSEVFDLYIKNKQ